VLVGQEEVQAPVTGSQPHSTLAEEVHEVAPGEAGLVVDRDETGVGVQVGSAPGAAEELDVQDASQLPLVADGPPVHRTAHARRVAAREGQRLRQRTRGPQAQVLAWSRERGVPVMPLTTAEDVPEQVRRLLGGGPLPGRP
jgi:hypothetical protein